MKSNFNLTSVSILLITLFLVSFVVADSIGNSPNIAFKDSDGYEKNDFRPGEDVYIYGSNFGSNSVINLDITRPDGVVESCSSSSCHSRFMDGLQYSDSFGNFLYRYDLDGIFGEYEVYVSDGVNSIQAIFTDANPSGDLDQCANGGVNDPPINPCSWQNGNLNNNQAHYVEGQSVAYRLKLTNMPVSGGNNCNTTSNRTCEVTIEYDIKDSSANAIDYLTHFQRILETVNPCDGFSTCMVAPDTLNDDIPLPNGIPQPQASFNALSSNEKRFQIYNGSIINLTYLSQGNLSAAHSSTRLKIKFKVNSSTAVLAWGGHIASRLDWGEGNSSGGISGSPYHMGFVELCTPQGAGLDCGGGNQDRSLSAGAVSPPNGTITIIKDTVPDNVQDFNFTRSFGSIFTLDDDGAGGSATPNKLSFNMISGIYNVTESAVAGYNLTNISCIDPTGGTRINFSVRKVSINLTSGENVTCTFFNAVLPFCGDGQLNQQSEQCDDGNQINTDSCRNNCTLPFCGDSIVDAGEQCDDGNQNNLDNCRNDCKFPSCGDNIVNGGEQCDDGNFINGDGCNSVCLFEYPQGGLDCYRLNASIGLELFAPHFLNNGNDTVKLSGKTIINRKNATLSPNNFTTIETEIIQMELTGATALNGPIRITTRGPGNSSGKLNQSNKTIQYPLMSFFDVYYAINLDNLSKKLNNSQALKLNGKVSNIPFAPGDSWGSANSPFIEFPNGTAGGRINSYNQSINTSVRCPVCGDSQVDIFEECDDGNTIDGDGCSSQCIIEFCGDRTIQPGLGEQCDDGNFANGDGCDSNCISEVCGNGIVQFGEQCDDGNINNNDGCSSNCVIEFCGDEITQTGEQCDDGNTNNNDGCSSICIVEFCGDGILQTAEQCDDGNQNNSDACHNNCTSNVCGDGIIYTGVEQCEFDADCNDSNPFTVDACSQCACSNINPVICGDGDVDVGEQCDDGNTNSSDLCSNNCTFTVCGDTFVQSPNGVGLGGPLNDGFEDCDDGNFDNTDSCLNSCTDASCGDGFVWFNVEECDDANFNNSDACHNNCTNNICGDGVLETGVEECDDGNLDNGDGCNANCVKEFCGDSIIQPLLGEGCDDGAGNTNIPCVPGYGSGCIYCDLFCETHEVVGLFCGDGIKNGPEQCDGNDLNGQTCLSQGYVPGILSCTSNCNYNYSGCGVNSTDKKDSKVSMALPAANFGLGRYMGAIDKSNGVDRSYLGFDLTGIGVNSVNSAQLEIFVYQTGSQIIGSIIEAWYCPDVDFNEVTINWNNQPSKWKNTGALLSANCVLADTYTVVNKVNSGLPQTKHVWDLTSEVNNALSTDKKFTIVIKHDIETFSTNNHLISYLTKDYPEANFRPKLVLS